MRPPPEPPGEPPQITPRVIPRILSPADREACNIRVGHLNETLGNLEAKERDLKRRENTLRPEIFRMEHEEELIRDEREKTRAADLVSIEKWAQVVSLLDQHQLFLNARRVDLATTVTMLRQIDEQKRQAVAERTWLRGLLDKVADVVQLYPKVGR